jgi:hypothetical protein
MIPINLTLQPQIPHPNPPNPPSPVARPVKVDHFMHFSYKNSKFTAKFAPKSIFPYKIYQFTVKNGE